MHEECMNDVDRLRGKSRGYTRKEVEAGHVECKVALRRPAAGFGQRLHCSSHLENKEAGAYKRFDAPRVFGATLVMKFF